MSENAHHLLIPFACVSSEAAAKHVQSLKLPNLRRLLDVLTLVDSNIGSEESFSPPHERTLARLQGLPVVDGHIPWAAQEAVALGLKDANSAVWGWVSLCSSVVGTGSLTLEDPTQLHVTEAESRQLLADMTPYFAEDGLTLHFVSSLEPSLWLCCGEPLRHVRTASLDRVIGKDLSEWQPAQVQPTAEPSQGGLAPSGGNAAHAVASVGATNSAKLRRLQNEMQMLLYTHTVNDSRNRAKTTTINSIWLHGTGELAGAGAGAKVSPNIKTSITIHRNLADAALKEDWSAWVKAWELLDATACADLLKRLQDGKSVTLTLCGEHSALRYELRQKRGFERLKGSFRSIFGLQPAYLLPKQL